MSTLNTFKTIVGNSRTYMTQNRFDYLSVISIEKDVEVDVTVIFDQFCTKNRIIIVN